MILSKKKAACEAAFKKMGTKHCPKRKHYLIMILFGCQAVCPKESNEKTKTTGTKSRHLKKHRFTSITRSRHISKQSPF
jgi:hypothetical protein